MYLLLSGEGPTDMGSATDAAPVCEGQAFLQGPMAVIVDQVVEKKLGYSVLGIDSFGFVSEHRLVERAEELKAAKKLRLPGKKRAKETRYFFNNARLLARIAREKEAERQEEVVAVCSVENHEKTS